MTEELVAKFNALVEKVTARLQETLPDIDYELARKAAFTYVYSEFEKTVSELSEKEIKGV